MSELLAALERLGSATVSELVAALGGQRVPVTHVIHEALEQGRIAVDPNRRDAYTLPRR